MAASPLRLLVDLTGPAPAGLLDPRRWWRRLMKSSGPVGACPLGELGSGIARAQTYPRSIAASLAETASAGLNGCLGSPLRTLPGCESISASGATFGGGSARGLQRWTGIRNAGSETW